VTDPIEQAAAVVGAAFGMTSDQMFQHIAIGDLPHPNAAPEHCGATDPRDDRKWCAQDKGHAGPHNNFRADDTVESYRARFGLGDRANKGDG
jgi:hypothetical protein